MENNIHQEESIDLGKLMQIMYDRRKTVGTIVGGCTALALIVSFALPKTYESTTLVQTRSAGKDMGGAAAMAAAMGIGGGAASPTLNYIELMKSRTVLDPIIDQLEWEDEKKKPTAKDFAKKSLKIENTKQTNLITVTATGKTPEEAQMISQGVVDNFLAMQTDKGQQTQSTLVQFLNDRITEAKKDAEDARTKFAEYQQNHKVYSPDEQVKAAVAKMNAFDEAIIRYVRRKHNVLIGKRTAEEVKISIGCLVQRPEVGLEEVRGRDILTGLPKSVRLTSTELIEAIREPAETILEAIHMVLEETPPELASDVGQNGILMSGGGSLIYGFDTIVQKDTGIPTVVVEDAVSCTAFGGGKMLLNLDDMPDGMVNLARKRQLKA